MRNTANLKIQSATTVKKSTRRGEGTAPLFQEDVKPKRIPPSASLAVSANRDAAGHNVFRLQTSIDLQYERFPDTGSNTSYRDAVCALCEKTVSLALAIPLVRLQSKTRSSAEVVFARQIAMYLSHTMFSILLTEVGLYFRRDRTTVSYACALIEDKRDDPDFDLMIAQLESLLTDARHAMCICVVHEPLAQRDSEALSLSVGGGAR